jgi:ADP-ribose pyrophosphatase YjhB (NUDIX family)
MRTLLALCFRHSYPLIRFYWRMFGKHVIEVRCLIIHDGRVLLIRHSYGPEGWSLPGGGARRNESPVAAISREVKEEVGISLPSVDQIEVNRVQPTPIPVKSLCFVAEVDSADFKLNGAEVAEARWFGLCDLPPNLFPEASAALALYGQQ